MDRATYFRTLFGKRDETLGQVLRGSLLSAGLVPMQIDDESARVLQLLVLLVQPSRVVEVGTFVGYSAIHIARALPVGGRLTTLEADPELAEMARRNIKSAEVSDRVDVVTGDARLHLDLIPDEGVDMIFIDADKRSYPDYLRLSHRILKPGGLLIADDAYADADFSRQLEGSDNGVEAIRAINTYNRAVVRSPMFFSALFGTANGLLVSRKYHSKTLAGAQTATLGVR
jgi:caffeoyl-CoA O-methyltransferase